MRISWVALGLLALLQGCGGDSTSAPVPSRLVVSPTTATLEALGSTQQFSARLEDEKGGQITGASVTWTSTHPEVASVDGNGLATALKSGSASIRASAGGLTASASLSVNPVPRELQKTAGDAQTGGMNQPLPFQPEVEVRDANGNPLPGVPVTFSVSAGEGMISQGQIATGADGRASTVWTLGCSNESPQRLEAFTSGINVTFTATADLSLPAICDTQVPDGRATHPYSTTLEVAGGDPATMAWSLASGTLPPGLALLASGILQGTPAQAGTSSFEARAQDGLGRFATGAYSLKICDAPLALAAGERAVLSPSGADGCGFFLPAGSNGDRYRFAVVYASSTPDSLDTPSATVSMTKVAAAAASPETASGFSLPFPSPPSSDELLKRLPEPLLEGVRVAAVTEAFHHQLREREREMIRSLGPMARPLPDQRSVLRVQGPQAVAPDKISLDPNEAGTCSAEPKVTAVKVAENDLMVIYQDSVQRASSPISASHAEMMLDYYRDYGKTVIDAYFGGVSDINGDGQVVVFVTPVVPDGVAAYVWSGDFFPRSQCAASNAMELVRFSRKTISDMGSGNYQALATLVHEVKHVSSLYKSIVRWSVFGSGPDPGYHPTWVEEGTAEIAGEMSSRLAWEATGGPPVGSMIKRADKVITKESYGVLLRWARTIGYLGTQPNGIVVTPKGASSSHSVYGSGWHFHRWLGDAYGGASNRLGDSTLFKALNDSVTASGVGGIQATAQGTSWSTLLEEYAAAVLLNGTPAPQPSIAFTSYDFPDVTTGLLQGQRAGFYPWPVNVAGDQTTGPFGSLAYTGTLGPSGMRVFDLTSDGTGLGLEVRVDATGQPIRIVAVRIQ